MSTPQPTAEAVLRAAEEIVAAFAANDGDRYFACFSPDATFCFHPEPARLNDRASYERLWRGWIDDGWRVLTCTSSNQLVQTFPGGAVFTHDVATTVATSDGEESTRERETIVFRVGSQGSDVGDGDADALVAIHEHLSPAAG